MMTTNTATAARSVRRDRRQRRMAGRLSLRFGG